VLEQEKKHEQAIESNSQVENYVFETTHQDICHLGLPGEWMRGE
jgi:hypothetical protein